MPCDQWTVWIRRFQAFHGFNITSTIKTHQNCKQILKLVHFINHFQIYVKCCQPCICIAWQSRIFQLDNRVKCWLLLSKVTRKGRQLYWTLTEHVYFRGYSSTCMYDYTFHFCYTEINLVYIYSIDPVFITLTERSMSGIHVFPGAVWVCVSIMDGQTTSKPGKHGH